MSEKQSLLRLGVTMQSFISVRSNPLAHVPSLSLFHHTGSHLGAHLHVRIAINLPLHTHMPLVPGVIILSIIRRCAASCLTV